MSETNQNTSLTQAINDMRTMRESYDLLTREINEDKKEIIHQMQFAGIDISSDASMAEVAERMREYTLIVRGNTEFVEGTYIRSLGDAIFDGLMSKELVSIETELPIAINKSWMSQANNIELKQFIAPNATVMDNTYLNGCSSLEYLDCPRLRPSDSSDYIRHLKYAHIDYYYVYGTNNQMLQFLRVVSGVRMGYHDFSARHFYSNVAGGIEYYEGYNSKSPNLYDCRLYQQAASNLNFSFYGNNLRISGASLITPDEWDDQNQPHFTDNGEKILWYFKHHFLYMDDGTPAFADMSETTAPTLTLGVNLKNLVMIDDEVATYFTERNWIVA